MVDVDSPVNDRDQMWQEWALKAQSGDKACYTLLLKDITPYIRNVISSRLANPDWADDIIQDVLISVHKSLHTYSPERPFRPWLYAIIGFRKTDFLRQYYRIKSHKTVQAEEAIFLADHVTNAPFAGELKDIEAALKSLPEKQAHLFILMKVKGYTVREIAKQMDMSESAVKVSVHRTAIKLREMMEHQS